MFKITKKIALVLFAVLFIMSVAFAEAPFDPKGIIDDFNANSSKVIPGKCLNVELGAKDRYTNVERDFLLYPYYCAMVVVDWEGSYGQVYRNNVYIDYIKVQGEWSLDEVFRDNNEPSVLIKEPTKPLPTPPAPPTKDDIIKLFDKWVPVYGTSDTFKTQVFSVSEPTMKWQGLDYESVVYTYTGKFRWTRSNASTRGLMAKLTGSTPDIWDADYSVTMIYTFADQRWTSDIQRKNEVQIQ